MSDTTTKCLDVFPEWLQSLGDDVRVMMRALKSEGLSDEGSRYLLGGINYLFKSLDLIPDGIDDIGYLDDAFILRLATKAAFEGGVESLGREDTKERLEELAKDTELLQEFLGDPLYKRLDDYARNLRKGAGRGRMVSEIVGNQEMFDEFAKEAQDFIDEFSAPEFTRDEKNLIKLTAFFEAKLPK